MLREGRAAMGAEGKGTKNLRKAKKKLRLRQHGKLARMSSHGEAAAADAAGRPGEKERH